MLGEARSTAVNHKSAVPVYADTDLAPVNLMHSQLPKIEPMMGSAFVQRTYFAVAALALLSLALTVAAHFFGHAISLGGHTEDATPREIVIGNNVLELPANMIRFARQRRDGVADRVDLYLRWPEMLGYRPEFLADFNGSQSEKRLLFLTFEPKATSEDMSGRYGPIYSTLTQAPGIKDPSGLTVQKFRTDSGFINEELLIGLEQAGRAPFVARCLDQVSAKDSLAPCQRDIFVGDDLQVTYRFPRKMLADWQNLDRQVRTFAGARLKAPK
jgi:type II secretory pathway component PulJ